MNTNWNEQPYFAALDWAKDHHDVMVVDRVGTVVADFQFPHTAPGWEPTPADASHWIRNT